MSEKLDKSSMAAAQRTESFKIEEGQYYLSLGLLCRRFGYWPEASISFECALKSFGNDQNSYSMGKSLILLGNTQACLGQYRTAGRYYQRAVYTFCQVDARHEIVYALRKLGLTRYWRGYLRSSVKLLEQAALYCEQGDCPYEEALTLMGLGYLYGEQKQYAFALSCYESADEIFDTFPTTREIVRYRAEILRALGQIGECKDYLEFSITHYMEALVLYEEIELVEAMGQVCYRLARIYEKLGLTATALYYQKQANGVAIL